MKNTDFLKLNEPEYSDKADILKISANMEWIDDAIKTLNALHAGLNQRIASLENKADNTSTAITDIRGDVSGIIRRIDGIVTQINAIDVNVNTNTSKINALAAQYLQDIADVTRQIAVVDAKMDALQARLTADVTALTLNKVDKESGKGLSTNDYSDSEKEKVISATLGIAKINSYFTMV